MVIVTSARYGCSRCGASFLDRAEAERHEDVECRCEVCELPKRLRDDRARVCDDCYWSEQDARWQSVVGKRVSGLVFRKSGLERELVALELEDGTIVTAGDERKLGIVLPENKKLRARGGER